MKKLLLVLCSYNSKEYTKRIYDELSEASDLIDIVVLDNSSEDNLISKFGNYIHIGFDNVDFGGMHDWILSSEFMNQYEFIGIFNSDIFGYTRNHIQVLLKYLNDDVGVVSFSISPEFDKSAGNGGMYTKENSVFREVEYIETVAPIFNVKLLLELKQYMPVHKYAFIDFFMSMRSTEIGLKNIIIDSLSFHHIRSGVRKQVGNYNEYIRTADLYSSYWINAYPELADYFLQPVGNSTTTLQDGNFFINTAE
jgi:hypothetical protein